MIIKRLTMHNFGVYAGTNTFDFNHEEPVVLIGGMNGRGKTTFLEAVLLALYGANSFAYKESKNRTYGQYLRSFVNRNDWSKTTYIELEFTTGNSKKDTYLVHREWDAITKRTRESIYVKQNGVEHEFLTKNWAMFIENILPSAISNFYFFDGEKIAELAVDSTNSQIKESIRAMLGITVLDVLQNDLKRNMRKVNRRETDGKSSDQLTTIRNERDAVAEEEELLKFRISDLEEERLTTAEELEQLKIKYTSKGGDIVEQRQELFQQRSELMAKFSQNGDLLLEAASAELPLLLIKNLLFDIKLQAEDEYNDYIMHQAMDRIQSLLIDYKTTLDNVHEAEKFVAYISNRIDSEKVTSLYGLSNQAIYQVNSLIDGKLDESAARTSKVIADKRFLHDQIHDVDSYLSLDINEKELGDIYKDIKVHEQRLIDIDVQLKSLKEQHSTVNAKLITVNAEFKRSVESFLNNMELKDDAARMLKYSNLAAAILEAYTIELQKRKTGVLGETITECYKKLANKKNMIQKIIMDPKTLDLSYKDRAGREVEKESLSAGEKQLMVVSILWALAICSKKKLPVIIDTPLSRLDSLHRTALITTYFPNASDQTIILSTDSEIDENYYKLMKNNVGDEFTLIYDENSQSTSISRGYFRRSS